MKKKKEDSSTKESKETEKSSKKRSKGRYSKKKGNNYELAIVNELKEQGYEAVSSRSESKNLDNEKVDIVSNYPYYIQCKCTQAKPDYAKIFKEFRLKDRPLAIFHKTQVKKEVNCISEGEFVIIKKQDFYNLIKR